MKKERSKKHRRLQLVRVGVQAFFFALFLWLLLGTHFTGKDYIGNVEAFFHFDPLLGIVAAIAGREVFAAFIWAAVTILVTVFLGRVVCGWVCPLGSVHQFFSWLFKKTKLLRPRKVVTGGLWWKYVVLVFVIIAAVLALDVAGYLDPLSFLTRTVTTSLLPAFAQGAKMVIGFVYGIGLEGIGDSLTQGLEKLTINGTFQQGFLIGLIFLGLIALNLFRERFWCRYVCPAGALLGLMSRANIYRVKVDEEKCIKCNLCTIQCQTQAHPWPDKDWKSSECVYCETCAAICPTAAITFPSKLKRAPLPAVDLGRRKVVLASLLAVFSVPFFRISKAGKRASPKLIRPPGALPEEQFLARCVKCGECMKACPTNALQPAMTEAGPEGMWTPVLVPEGRLLRILLLALLPGLPDRGDQGADHPGEDRLRDRHGLDQQEPLHPLFPGPAMHRLRGALPDVAQGDQVRHGRDQARRRDDGDAEGPGHGPGSVHRVRDLREQVPGDGRSGDLRDERRRAAQPEEPAPA